MVVAAAKADGDASTRYGYICSRTTDAKLRSQIMGEEVFARKYGVYFNGNPIPGPPKVWDWEGEILPARIYLRHCILAIQKQAGQGAVERFMDDTLLWDRKTTVRQHLAANPLIMSTAPPVDHPDSHKFNG